MDLPPLFAFHGLPHRTGPWGPGPMDLPAGGPRPLLAGRQHSWKAAKNVSDAFLWGKGGCPRRPVREPPGGGGGGGMCQQKTLGFRVSPLYHYRGRCPRGQGCASKKPSGLGFLLYTTTVGGARGAGMHGASRLALPRLRVRVFSPLGKLGPLRAPRGGCRALSEDFGVWGLGFGV